MDFPGLWVAELEQTQLRKERRSHPRFEAVGITCKPKKAARLPQEPHSPLGEPTILCSRRMKVS